MSAALLAVAAVVLVVSGVAHLRDRGALAAVLVRHGVLAHGLRRLTAALLPAVEVLLGSALLIAIGAGATGASFVLGIGAAALFLAFALYLHLASRVAGAIGMPCGCGVGEAPLGFWVVARAVLLAVVSGAGAVGAVTGGSLGGAGVADVGGAVQVLVSTAAVVALVVAISVLPAARAVPLGGRGASR